MESETFFLALSFIAEKLGPAGADAVRNLESRAIELGHLPTRTDVQGNEHPLNLAELQQRNSHLPRDALSVLLRHLLERRRRDAQPGVQWLNTLLGAGRLSLVSHEATRDSPPAINQTRTCANDNTSYHLHKAHQRCQPLHGHSSLPRAHLLIELNGRRAWGSQLRSPAMCLSRLSHTRTFRGHRMAVYCLEFSVDGSLLITGSDDWLVKIWSCQSGRLMRTCRGHESEVTDLAVSKDGHLLASASTDTMIRIWCLQSATMGYPVQVLVGHQAPVTSVTFYPSTEIQVILSSSDDGTCRVWNAIESSSSLVLNPGPHFALPLVPPVHDNGPGCLNPSVQPTINSIAAGQPLVASLHGTRVDGTPAWNVLPTANGTRNPAAAASGTSAPWDAPNQDPDVIVMHDDEDDAVPSQAHAPLAVVNTAGDAGVGGAQGVKLPQNYCQFTRDGSGIISASADGNIYIWQWDLPSIIARRCMTAKSSVVAASASHDDIQGASDKGLHVAGNRLDTVGFAAHQNASSSSSSDVLLTLDDVVRGQWPPVKEVAKLVGLGSDVLFVRLSHRGDSFACITKAGPVRVWHLNSIGSWSESFALHCTVDEADVARQRRRTVQPPTATFLSWNADDSRIVMVADDFSLRVWDASHGTSLHVIKAAHTEMVLAIDCHPHEPSLALTTGVDGRTVVWDIFKGQQMKSFSTMETMPLMGARWTDPLQLLDGKWTPDGLGLVVCDSAGQFHIYRADEASPGLMRWPYDQFLLLDYAPCTRDENQWVVDTDHQVPPHLIPQTLLDRMDNPYPVEVQEAVRTGCSDGLPVITNMELPQGLVILPPIVTSAIWQALVRGQSQAMIQSASDRAMERHRQSLHNYYSHMAAAATREANRARGGSEAGPGGDGGSQALGRVMSVTEITSVSITSTEPSSGSTSPSASISEEDSDQDATFSGLSDEEEDSDHDGGRTARDASRRHQGTRRSARNRNRRGRRVRGGDGSAGPSRPEGMVRQTRQSKRLGTRKRTRSQYQPDDVDDGDVSPTPTTGERSLEAEQEEWHDTDSGTERPNRRRQQRRQRQRQRQSSRQPRQPRRTSRQTGGHMQELLQREQAEDEEEEEEEDNNDEGQGAVGPLGESVGQLGPGRPADPPHDLLQMLQQHVLSRQGQSSQGPSVQAVEGIETGPAPPAPDHIAQDDLTPPAPPPPAARIRIRVPRPANRAPPPPPPSLRDLRPRQHDAYGWLLVTQSSPACFLPQVCDEVCYLRTGHEAFLEQTKDKHTIRPALFLEDAVQDMTKGDIRHELSWWSMRPAEPCQVVSIEYFIAGETETSPTLPRLTLQLLDCPAGLPQRLFQVVIPSPQAGFADFIVLRCRYEAAVLRKWRAGDMLKTYSIDESGGQWWDARLVTDKHERESGRRKWEDNLRAEGAGPSRPSRTMQGRGRGSRRADDEEDEYMGEEEGADDSDADHGRSSRRPQRRRIPSVKITSSASRADGVMSLRSRGRSNVVSGTGAGQHQEGTSTRMQLRHSRHVSSDHESRPRGGGRHSDSVGLYSDLMYALPCQWERYGISWNADSGKDSDVDQWLSPWEMYGQDSTWEQTLSQDPALDPQDLNKALSAIQSVLPGGAHHQDSYDLYETAPDPDAAFLSQHPDFNGHVIYYNARVPLPLGLRDIEGRLHARYYRQVASFRCDLDLLVDNALWFNGQDSDAYACAQRLRQVVVRQLGQM